MTDEKKVTLLDIEKAKLEVDFYDKITWGLEGLALLYEKDTLGSGKEYASGAVHHRVMLEEREGRLKSMQKTYDEQCEDVVDSENSYHVHVLGKIIKEGGKNYTVCPECEERVELVQETFDVLGDKDVSQE